MIGATPIAITRSGDKFATFVRSDFWFLDGNIVIIAGTAAFKVHRGQLGRHSEVFNGLFSIPQPNEQELLDGCHCVELYDCPSDVFYFLSALYDGLCVEISIHIVWRGADGRLQIFQDASSERLPCRRRRPPSVN